MPGVLVCPLAPRRESNDARIARHDLESGPIDMKNATTRTRLEATFRLCGAFLQNFAWLDRPSKSAPQKKSSLMATVLWPPNLIEVSDYFLATTNRSTINIQTSSKLSAGFQKIQSMRDASLRKF